MERGGVLRISAEDNFEVVRVTCALRTPNGTVLAVGAATLRSASCTVRATWHTTEWDYVAPQLPAAASMLVAVVIAFDRPGNFHIKAFVVCGRAGGAAVRRCP